MGFFSPFSKTKAKLSLVAILLILTSRLVQSTTAGCLEWLAVALCARHCGGCVQRNMFSCCGPPTCLDPYLPSENHKITQVMEFTTTKRDGTRQSPEEAQQQIEEFLERNFPERFEDVVVEEEDSDRDTPRTSCEQDEKKSLSGRTGRALPPDLDPGVLRGWNMALTRAVPGKELKPLRRRFKFFPGDGEGGAGVAANLWKSAPESAVVSDVLPRHNGSGRPLGKKVRAASRFDGH